MINQAERRIFISSLYIGSEEGGLVCIDPSVGLFSFNEISPDISIEASA